MTTVPRDQGAGTGIADVLQNRPFLLLWLAQAVTQIGGNMVLFGLTVIIVSTSDSNAAVSALILSFLVPAVLFSAVAGVYVDRIDRRLLLVVTNAIRGVAFVLVYFAGANLLVILLLTVFVSTVTVFFAPAEAAMIPFLVPRRQLLAANALFTLTLNAAFALGFALLGPLVVALAGADTVIFIVAVLYLAAAAMCLTLPSAPAPSHTAVKPLQAVADAERAVEGTLAQLREGVEYIRSNRAITWSLVYLGIASSLIGVLGVLGPDFARETLGLDPKGFVVVVLPLGAGIVMGVLLLNSYGKYIPRRRVIEAGLIGLGVALALLSVAGPISRFLQRADQSSGLIDLSALTSLLAIVVFIAFFAGIAYAIVAIPAQTQLSEDLPEDVRGRVFGVLNMLVSVSSFLPIIVVGYISEVIGTGTVILIVAILIGGSGVVSVIRRGPLKPAERIVSAGSTVVVAAGDPIGAMTHAEPAVFADPYAQAEGANVDVAPWILARQAAERKARAEGREPAPSARSRVGKAAARLGRKKSTPERRPPPRPVADPVDPSAQTVKVEVPDSAEDEGRRDRD
jgi:MFS family permease